MPDVVVESGVVLGFGGTNARFGVAEKGDITGFTSISTPPKSREFFGWMANQILDATEAGHSWMVAGFPGPVTPDGELIGPFENVPGLSDRQYKLTEELTAADAAAERILSEGFKVIAVNDGELAAQAAAVSVGGNRFTKTAALILGTGVGAGIVKKDPAFTDVHRADRSNPTEIGHLLLSDNPADTFENLVSGPSLERDYKANPEELPNGHMAWRRVGSVTGRLATMLGMMNGAELVVPCGGVGSGASEKYWPYLEEVIQYYVERGNRTQRLFLPEIFPVPASQAQTFELFGGEPVMRDFLTRAV